MLAIRAEGLTKKFDGLTAVCNVSFSVNLVHVRCKGQTPVLSAVFRVSFSRKPSGRYEIRNLNDAT